MVTITLPPELERIVTEQARWRGTTPEILSLDKLQEAFQPAVTLPEAQDEGTMLDFFAGYVGVLQSGETTPGGAQMSQDADRKFAEGMLKKRQEGKL